MATTVETIGALVIGAIVVVLVVGGTIWLSRKGYFEPDTNTEGIEDREDLADSVRQEEFRIPYRRRVSSWSGPYKVFVGSLVLLLLGFGVATYQMFKTGSPFQQFVTREIQFAAVAVIGIAGGVRLKAALDGRVGYLQVIYERSGAEDLVERIPYAKSRVRRRDGTITVPEIHDSRLLGLFWRYRQVGEDRRLRGANKPLDDVIVHQVPDHGWELPEGAGFAVTTREDGDQVLEGQTSPADVTYSSPHSMSRERAIENREKVARKEAELRAVKATNAQLYQRINKLQKQIENEEYLDREELLGDLREITEMVNSFNVNLRDEIGKGNGSSGDAEGASAS